MPEADRALVDVDAVAAAADASAETVHRSRRRASSRSASTTRTARSPRTPTARTSSSSLRGASCLPVCSAISTCGSRTWVTSCGVRRMARRRRSTSPGAGATCGRTGRLREEGRVPVHRDLLPGRRTRLPDPRQDAVRSRCRYALEIDVVHEHVRWFGCTAEMPVTIDPAAATADAGRPAAGCAPRSRASSRRAGDWSRSARRWRRRRHRIHLRRRPRAYAAESAGARLACANWRAAARARPAPAPADPLRLAAVPQAERDVRHRRGAGARGRGRAGDHRQPRAAAGRASPPRPR